MKLWTVNIEHRFGEQTHAFASEDGAWDWLHLWVQQWWAKEVNERRGLGAKLPEGRDEAIGTYFDIVEEEHYQLGETIAFGFDDLDGYLKDANDLVRPDGSLEPGYEGFAVDLLVRIVNKVRSLNLVVGVSTSWTGSAISTSPQGSFPMRTGGAGGRRDANKRV